MKKKCPRLEIVLVHEDKQGRYREFEARAAIGGQRVGAIDLSESRSGARKILIVKNILVQPEFERCGIGTKLYTKAAQLACAEGRLLTSDQVRSKCSDGFWQKQVAKKRAKCTGGKWATGVQTHATDARPGCGRVIGGRSGCAWYALTKPCPTTLTGARKK